MAEGQRGFDPNLKTDKSSCRNRRRSSPSTYVLGQRVWLSTRDLPLTSWLLGSLFPSTTLKWLIRWPSGLDCLPLVGFTLFSMYPGLNLCFPPLLIPLAVALSPHHHSPKAPRCALLALFFAPDVSHSLSYLYSPFTFFPLCNCQRLLDPYPNFCLSSFVFFA